jgi:hypothetical protein
LAKKRMKKPALKVAPAHVDALEAHINELEGTLAAHQDIPAIQVLAEQLRGSIAALREHERATKAALNEQQRLNEEHRSLAAENVAYRSVRSWPSRSLT